MKIVFLLDEYFQVFFFYILFRILHHTLARYMHVHRSEGGAKCFFLYFFCVFESYRVLKYSRASGLAPNLLHSYTQIYIG